MIPVAKMFEIHISCFLTYRPGFCTDRCVSIDSNGSAGTVIRQLPVGNDGILFSRKLQNAAVSDQMKLC